MVDMISPVPPPNIPVIVRASETDEHKYARQSRNANVFVAWVVGIFTVLSLIGAIWIGTSIASAVNSFNNLGGTSTSSTCFSQGGTDLSC